MWEGVGLLIGRGGGFSLWIWFWVCMFCIRYWGVIVGF